jgi:hypothetical protein
METKPGPGFGMKTGTRILKTFSFGKEKFGMGD